MACRSTPSPRPTTGLTAAPNTRWPTKRRKVSAAKLEEEKEVILKTPKVSCKAVAKHLGCSKSWASRLMKSELKLKPLKVIKAPKLRGANRVKRKVYCARMLRRLKVGNGDRVFGKSPPALQLSNILFTDEKIFRYEHSGLGGSSAASSTQNCRIWVEQSVKKEEVPGEHLYMQVPAKSKGLMVACGVCQNHLLPPTFVSRGVKLDSARAPAHRGAELSALCPGTVA